jgi:glycine hydroxymethyltransferase
MLVDLRAFSSHWQGGPGRARPGRHHPEQEHHPDDPLPFVTSGVRIGTPSVTTQGMKEPEMVAIAELIARALRDRGNPAELAAVREDVAVLCGKFTPYAA